MKRLILLALIGCSVAIAQDQPAPPAKPKKSAKKKITKTDAPPAAKTAQPLTIPKDAVLNANGSYSWTDKSGQKWLYNKTPFGVSKIQDTTGSAPSGFAAVPQSQIVKTTDNGDTVKFTKQSPFGATTWEKKKSEMTDEERSIFQTQHPENHQ
jgi:hypothetical protein